MKKAIIVLFVSCFVCFFTTLTFAESKDIDLTPKFDDQIGDRLRNFNPPSPPKTSFEIPEYIDGRSLPEGIGCGGIKINDNFSFGVCTNGHSTLGGYLSFNW